MAGRDFTGQGKSGWRGQGRTGQRKVGKCEGNEKDHEGQSALQEKAKDMTVCALGGGQNRADYK